ncbi:MAG: hypothetical protein ABSE87_11990 [Terracidiphilus sp.]|jgi:hypothetical protein
MKPRFAVLLASASLAIAVQAGGATLPAACGREEVKLNVTTQKRQPGGPAASADRSTLIFVQRNSLCVGCSTTRVGLDGTWVGADKGNSFFAVTVAPGEHHVCASWGAPLARTENKIGLTELTAEAGQMYYFEIAVERYGRDDVPIMQLKPISNDLGAFLVARSKESVATSKGN